MPRPAFALSWVAGKAIPAIYVQESSQAYVLGGGCAIRALKAASNSVSSAGTAPLTTCQEAIPLARSE
jgi:hypothetical protein